MIPNYWYNNFKMRDQKLTFGGKRTTQLQLAVSISFARSPVWNRRWHLIRIQKIYEERSIHHDYAMSKGMVQDSSRQLTFWVEQTFVYVSHANKIWVIWDFWITLVYDTMSNQPSSVIWIWRYLNERILYVKIDLNHLVKLVPEYFLNLKTIFNSRVHPSLHKAPRCHLSFNVYMYS